MSQLDIWRVEAFKRLTELISALKGEANASDALVDDLVRSLSKLPNRPADRTAYTGIFAVKDTAEGRKKAIERLRTLTSNLKGDLASADGLIDNTIRGLSNLPKRPADKQPYASLFPTSKIKLLTSQNLITISPETSPKRAEQLIPELNRTMLEFDITTPLRQAHFLAQLTHESDHFNALEEYASGEDYEWRDDLGNIYPGDGVRFKGRGLIQITGRKNYRECGRVLGVDLISNPTRLSDPDLASRSAGWYWDSRQLNSLADRDDVRGVTQAINGGLNGLDDRIHFLSTAKQILGI